ncbi:DNA polymerase III subunit delta [Prochlorococcus marinus]|uniref:DNA polymerase III subunit delta n=1 Tax=Prochlorococcus marinus XMU1408 TaxID=2213228 RepID=A0A318QZS0_PROMR|nr:DNA polymerase III subunit delta [Prochlorococcus marinus]MBW3042896.1 DNA polymerase III subunit delta [Prochlorococcus marinus str. XMU1408]PYE00253.1 DNA polymerase III subunit delta [Prochlorococcus marinus XMU1408]
MPIHLIWGDDYEGSNREIEGIIQTLIDPAWKSFNYSQIDGNDPKQNFRALEEVQSAPLGNGNRIVLVRRSPFCNACSIELANKLEQTIKLIPDNTYLILNNSNKPDKRLKTTKLIQKSIQSNPLSTEKSFVLPLPWDLNGQRNLVKNIARNLNLKINHATIDLIVESIGSDSSLINTELQKLALLSEASNDNLNTNGEQEITKNLVEKLIQNNSTNALDIASLLLQGEIIIALNKIKSLLDSGEPSLRLITTLTGQARGWLWVNLLDSEGNQDVKEIAKLIGIANPKRIFVIRKQIQGKSFEKLLGLMKKLLIIEALIKSGTNPMDAFKDNLLTESKIMTNS